MTTKLVQVGSAVLATMAIGGAAMTVGVTTAGAAGIIGGLPTGSVGQTPWLVDEAMDQLRPCGPSYPYPDRGPCYSNGFWNSGLLGDYEGTYYGPDEVEPGAEAEFTAQVVADIAAYAVPNPETDVDVTSVTYQPPEGFEFVGVIVRGALAGDRNNYVELPSTVGMDPDSGRITVSAPAGGWAMIPYLDGGSRWESTGVILDFTLRAPEGRTPGRTGGFTFTGTSVPASNGVVATGTTRVWPELAEGTGS
jgi:hypothetical protein